MITPSHLQAIAAKAAQASVVVVGDMMIDEFVWGAVTRISPDAPVPVLCRQSVSYRPSGALIVARVAQALSNCVDAVGVVGDDESGRRLVALASAAGMRVHPLVDPERPTTLKTRFYAQNQQLLRVDHECDRFLPGEIEDSLIDRVLPMLGGTRALVLSDYAKGVLTTDVCKRLLTEARSQAIPVIVDTKRVDAERYRGATIMTPNAVEMDALCERVGTAGHDFEYRAKSIIQHYELTALLVTQGADGMTLVTRDSPSVSVSALPVASPSVAGAGDAVTGSLAVCVAAEVPLPIALWVIRLAACCVVRQRGTADVSLATLMELARSEGQPSAASSSA